MVSRGTRKSRMKCSMYSADNSFPQKLQNTWNGSNHSGMEGGGDALSTLCELSALMVLFHFFVFHGKY